MTRTLAERVAAALPCWAYSGCSREAHERACPAYQRHIVLALLRELREECAEVAGFHEGFWMLPEGHGSIEESIRRIGEPE